jgi:diguanylate cyclase (GGDEF)-like protein
MEQMQGAERYIQDISSTDRLTGLLNHRAFEEILGREHRKAERDGNPYCILMIDVENVGQLNESLGHDAGNQLLIAVAAAIARSIRATDIAARFGGDEFAVLLTNTDHLVGASVAQRIRSHVYAGTISVANRMIRANVHLGSASFPKDKRTSKDVLILADQRMQADREPKAGLAK